MEGFLTEYPTLTHNSIPLENYSQLDKMSGYVAGSLRIYNNIIYKAIIEIDPMVLFCWFNGDSSNIYGYDNTLEQNIQNPTSFDIVVDVTTFFVESNQKYYIANKTATIDLTTEDINSPANFTEVSSADYRHESLYPDGKNDTLYWSYQGSTNQTAMFDGVINAQSENNRSISGTNISFVGSTNTIVSTTEILNIFDDDKIKIVGSTLNDGEYEVDTVAIDKLSFTVKETTIIDESAGSLINIYTYTYIKFTESGIDRIGIFNTLCDEIEIKTTVGVITQTYNIQMVDTTNITDFEGFCFDDAEQLQKHIQSVLRDYDVEFEVTFKGLTQSIGEFVIGSSFDMGKAEDNTSLSGSSYNNPTEATNGDVYFEDEIQKIVTKSSYNVVTPTNTIPTVFRNNNKLINKKMVINGSANDKEDLSYLISYGFVKVFNITPTTNAEFSKYKFEIRTIL